MSFPNDFIFHILPLNYLVVELVHKLSKNLLVSHLAAIPRSQCSIR